MGGKIARIQNGYLVFMVARIGTCADYRIVTAGMLNLGQLLTALSERTV